MLLIYDIRLDGRQGGPGDTGYHRTQHRARDKELSSIERMARQRAVRWCGTLLHDSSPVRSTSGRYQTGCYAVQSARCGFLLPSMVRVTKCSSHAPLSRLQARLRIVQYHQRDFQCRTVCMEQIKKQTRAQVNSKQNERAKGPRCTVNYKMREDEESESESDGEVESECGCATVSCGNKSTVSMMCCYSKE